MRTQTRREMCARNLCWTSPKPNEVDFFCFVFRAVKISLLKAVRARPWKGGGWGSTAPSPAVSLRQPTPARYNPPAATSKRLDLSVGPGADLLGCLGYLACED